MPTLKPNPRLLATLLFGLLLATKAGAQTNNALSDETLLRETQARLQMLHDNGIIKENYQFAKAKAWYAFARDEYFAKDTSGIVAGALAQSIELIEALETGGQATLETPIVSGSRKIRADLWALITTLKKAQTFDCFGDSVARLEVQLVWAGHTQVTLGWRHATPYLQAAERLARTATLKAQACVPVPPVAISMTATESASETIVRLAKRVYFGFNAARISPTTATILNHIAKVLREHPEIYVELHGHADSRGNQAYNLRLSEQRALAVKHYLAQSDVSAERLNVRVFGSSKPMLAGTDEDSHAHNRRVEFIVSEKPSNEVIR